jgi:hypothetical protein
VNGGGEKKQSLLDSLHLLMLSYKNAPLLDKSLKLKLSYKNAPLLDKSLKLNKNTFELL